eukprot:357517-Chlamydomonas_euryale.AAC.2
MFHRRIHLACVHLHRPDAHTYVLSVCTDRMPTLLFCLFAQTGCPQLSPAHVCARRQVVPPNHTFHLPGGADGGAALAITRPPPASEPPAFLEALSDAGRRDAALVAAAGDALDVHVAAIGAPR